jgi:flagellar basal body-associated protein FliL
VYIKQELLSGKIKNAKRNATIIIAIGMIAVMFLLVMGVLIWLALL